MSSTLLATELTNLISESKRKNVELRNAAEKSLQELKGLPATSDQQLAAGKSVRDVPLNPSCTDLQEISVAVLHSLSRS